MFEKICAYLSKQLDIPVESITEDTTFESLGIDSLDIVEMVVDLEDELGIELELKMCIRDRVHAAQRPDRRGHPGQ